VCPYLESFGAYPRKYAREIYNNAAIVMGARTANALINSCSLCGLCATVCPEDFGMHELCQPARKDMVRQGKMPPSAHEFALQDMAFSLGDDFFMARHASATRRSSHLFFPGCQLCASSPGQVEDVYGHLCSTIEGGVGLMLGCCGAPAYWAGRQEDFDQILAVWQQQWESLGQPPLILACATCYQMFQTHWPAVPIQSLWETLERVGLPTKNRYVPSGPLAVHDPCTTRAVPAVQAAVRRLLKVLGVETTELPLGRATTECCGYGGLMQNANPSLAREVVRRRAALSSHDYLAYCAMCRDNLAQGGKRALHLLDLLFADPQYPDPAARPRPGWSPRRENRARLKAALLEKHWQQAPSAVQAYRSIILRIAPTVQERLEERRILAEDLKQTIAHAEAGGPKLRHPDTGRFRAAFRPRHVTFWVEYAPDGHAFIVYNAYAHRMEVSRS
jgi:Fe-S oxidoreductase